MLRADAVRLFAGINPAPCCLITGSFAGCDCSVRTHKSHTL